MRRLPIAIVAGCWAGLGLVPDANRATAQEWPTKVVRVIVPLTVGGGGDIFARAIAEELKNDLGQPFVVENRSGAAEIIGTRGCAEAAPDGYTVCVTSQEPIVFNQVLFKSLPYDPEKDLVSIVKLYSNPAVIAITASRGINSLAEMVAAAKAKPGQKAKPQPAAKKQTAAAPTKKPWWKFW